MGALEGIAREPYDWTIGLELSEMIVDCRINKTPWGDEKAGRCSVDRGKRSMSAPRPSRPAASRLGS